MHLTLYGRCDGQAKGFLHFFEIWSTFTTWFAHISHLRTNPFHQNVLQAEQQTNTRLKPYFRDTTMEKAAVCKCYAASCRIGQRRARHCIFCDGQDTLVVSLVQRHDHCLTLARELFPAGEVPCCVIWSSWLTWHRLVDSSPFLLLSVVQRLVQQQEGIANQDEARLACQHTQEVVQQLNSEGRQYATLHSALLRPLAYQEGGQPLTSCSVQKCCILPRRLVFLSLLHLHYFHLFISYKVGFSSGHVSHNKKHGNAQPSFSSSLAGPTSVCGQGGSRLPWQKASRGHHVSARPDHPVNTSRDQAVAKPWSRQLGTSGPPDRERERYAQPRRVVHLHISLITV